MMHSAWAGALVLAVGSVPTYASVHGSISILRLLRIFISSHHIHSPKIRHETPRTVKLCKLMLLHQGNYGLVHNLVYTAAMTVAFNINMIVWNLEKKGT
jgi:hypothetical protein